MVTAVTRDQESSATDREEADVNVTFHGKLWMLSAA